MLIEARERVSHQGSSNSLLHLIVASIKSQRNGTRLLRDLDEPIASETATGSEVIGECVEGIRGEVSREIWKLALMCLGFFRFGAQCLIGSVARLR